MFHFNMNEGLLLREEYKGLDIFILFFLTGFGFTLWPRCKPPILLCNSPRLQMPVSNGLSN